MVEALRDAPARCIGLPVQLSFIEIAEGAPRVAGDVRDRGLDLAQ
jgi:hypothetical protein